MKIVDSKVLTKKKSKASRKLMAIMPYTMMILASK